MVKFFDNKLVIEITTPSPNETLHDLQHSLLHLLLLKDSQQVTDGVAEWNAIHLLTELLLPLKAYPDVLH
ncbi:hypothetical protein [Pinibacter aurantiacus]|uniref:Uncharacterized protein n=1 Tax=Pinibacter aurantiacus TaxID=2851599 RepID=A0A9E2S9M4_9BACT|nr:hypothetical protein [Pinibacter aurantiacus]MBV4358971.1 hypothetical protein [Pinibacter aurantiacus]